MLSNSRGPQTLFSDRGVIGCEIGTIDEAATFGDIVVVAIPMKHYQAVPVEPLVGKIVIDTNNYYSDRDAGMPELEDEKTTSSELLANHLPRSKVVKAFNAILMPHFDRDGEPAGALCLFAATTRRRRRSSQIFTISSATTRSTSVLSLRAGDSSLALLFTASASTESGSNAP
ncbi:NADPH-dependent F420 reductase [Variovorax paradoxus]|uniref:NADPH-dependent F420 reductase n=1 Tax=Variovorax paradoxus TaxID=34073 RepID=UPI001F18A28F|nr:NAD(P)-binding domain-containing protein [Variovorax paradoxus]UKI08719.1 NAD(P)-binding domain-containing protein [Variovorax paradoxus]